MIDGAPANVLDFGADNTGVADSSSAINSAIASGAKYIYLPAGTYKCNSAISLKAGVSIFGDGKLASIIDYRGTTNALVANEGISYVSYEKFGITNANNSNSSVSGMVFNYGCSRANFSVRYVGKSGDTSNGIVIYGTQNNDGVTANNNQYGCVFDCNITSSGTEITGAALRLNGSDVSNARANAHYIASGTYDGFSTGIYINGNGNVIGCATVNGASYAGIHFYGDGTFGNVINGTYLDSAITGDPIVMEMTAQINYVFHLIRTVNASVSISDVSVAPNYGQYVAININKFKLPHSGDVAPSSMAGVCSLTYDSGNQITGFFANEENVCGGIMFSGSNFAAGVNKVGNAGSAAVQIKSGTAADFRVVKTTNGTAYSPIFKVDNDGVIYPTGQTTRKWLCSTGSPEGVVTAGIGSLYTRTDGGAGTTLYIKESGTGNTGWVAK
jgi:hypothetical protein